MIVVDQCVLTKTKFKKDDMTLWLIKNAFFFSKNSSPATMPNINVEKDIKVILARLRQQYS